MCYDKTKPCKDCKDRYVGCHDKCPRYQEYIKLLNEQKAKYKKAKQIEDSYWLVGGNHDYINFKRGYKK